MNERHEYPAGVPCWVDVFEPDPEAAAGFYAGVFGWEFEDRAPAGAPGRYLVGRVGGLDVAAIGSALDGAPAPAWITYVAVDDADAAAARAVAAGGEVLMGPADVGDAGRVAQLADPEGAVFGIWQAGAAAGAQLVNAPGSWNFSDLTTADPEGAAAFYGAVFGWEATPMEGMDEGAMLRMPGYGDHLAALDPGFRERMTEAGAPEGFEDAVAWLMPAPEGQDEARWGITFAVADADAAAEGAAARGGTVLAPPFDAPWVRMTVLRDPQGAQLTASRYVPPGEAS